MNLRCIFGHDRVFLPGHDSHFLTFRPWRCSRCPAFYEGFKLPSAPPMPPCLPANARNTGFVLDIVRASGERADMKSWAAAMEAADAFHRSMRGPPPANEDR